MQSLAAERAWTDRTKLAELEHRLEAWARTQTRQQISNASKALGLALGAVWTPAELLADPQYQARQFFRDTNGVNGAAVRPGLPVIAAAHGESGATSRRHRVASGGGPLAGLRIIDLGILTAGASTSAILADLGADVIKVESPTYLDPFRGTPGTSRADGWWNNSDAFKSTNRNKRGMCLDLKSPRGRKLFLELAAQSDVVVENFRRGVMQRLGIGYDALRAANNGIILASVSSQGENGPDAGNISFGSTLEATSGLAALTAYEDGVPLVTGMDLNYPDQVGSVFAAAAIVASLHAVQRSGVGVHLDISQRELTTYLLGDAIMASAHEGAAARGNASPEYLLQDTFATKDGWIAISLKDETEVMRALALANPSVTRANDPNLAFCRQALSAWAAGERSQDICDRLKTSGLAASAVWNGQDAWAYAQRSLGGAIQPLARSPSGEIVKGFPLHFAATAHRGQASRAKSRPAYRRRSARCSRSAACRNRASLRGTISSARGPRRRMHRDSTDNSIVSASAIPESVREMRAVRCHHWGAPDVLAVEEIEAHLTGPGEVRIRVEASAVNFTDTLIVAGKYQFKPKLPHIPGHELAGVVLETGEGVTDCAVGDRVMASARHGGGFAEEYVAAVDKVYRIPDNMSFEAAAGFIIGYGTAYFALKYRGSLQPRRNAAGQWRSRRCRPCGDPGRQGVGCPCHRLRIDARQDRACGIIWCRLLHQLRRARVFAIGRWTLPRARVSMSYSIRSAAMPSRRRCGRSAGMRVC